MSTYTNTVIKKGTILYTLYPHGMKPNILSNPTPNYYVDHKQVLSTRGKGARAYNDAIQISHNDNYSGARPMRTQLHKFVVTKDICVAQGVAKNNSNFGAGGGTQYFISNNNKMSIKPTTMIYKIK